MKKSSFTLVELLVVIGIIGILAGMIMPALAGARTSGIRTDCINNRHQLGLGVLQYAGDNKQVIPFLLKKFGTSSSSVSNANYAVILSGKKGKKNKTDADTSVEGVNSYLPSDKTLLCPEANTQFLYTNGVNAVGMLDLYDDSGFSWYKGSYKNGEKKDKDVIEVLGRFCSKKDKKNVVYHLSRMKDPANLILFADTFIKDSSESYNTYYSFLPGSSVGKGYVTTPHQVFSVVGMADGSSQAIAGGDLYHSSVEVQTTLEADLIGTKTAK